MTATPYAIVDWDTRTGWQVTLLPLRGRTLEYGDLRTALAAMRYATHRAGTAQTTVRLRWEPSGAHAYHAYAIDTPAEHVYPYVSELP